VGAGANKGTAMTATLPDPILNIGRDVHGEVVAGNYNVVQIVKAGATVYSPAPGEDRTPKLKSLPISLEGKREPRPVGRDDEIATGLASIADGTCLELCGPDGIGKSTLLRYLAGAAPTSDAPHGRFMCRAFDEPPAQTAQRVFEAFYVTPPLYPKSQIREYLRDIEALVALDDVTADRQGVDELIDALPSATLVMSSSVRRLWRSGGRSLRLRGLPAAAAVQLLERELKRPLAAGEGEAATALVEALGGHPHRVGQLGAVLKETEGVDLSSFGGGPGSRTAAVRGDLHDQLFKLLDDDQRRVYEALDRLDGATLGTAMVAEVTGIDDPEPALRALRALRLIKAHSPRYSVTIPSRSGLRAQLPDEPSGWDAQLTASFIRWAERNRDEPDVVVTEREAVQRVLRLAAQSGAWSDVLRLARAVEVPFMLGRRWGTWQEVLHHELAAATRMRDRAAEGWALHQLGTRALCMEDVESARRDLTRALHIREALGDKDGVAATRHNLGFLPGGGDKAPPDPPPPLPPRVPPALPPRPPVVPLLPLPAPAVAPGGLIGLPLVLTVLVVILAVVGVVLVTEDDSDSELSTGPVSTGISVEPARVDFGRQPVGPTSEARTVTISGAPDTATGVRQIGLRGADADAFRLQHSCPPRLEPGQACQARVSFAPGRDGPHVAALSVGGSGEELATALLSGRGEATKPGPVRLRWEPAQLDFGQRPLNGAPVVQGAVLRNLGADAVDLTRLAVGGTAAADYSLRGDCGGRIARGSSCTVEVAFTAHEPGSRPASLVATPRGSPETVESMLWGQGTAPCSLAVSPIGPRTAAYGDVVDLPVRSESGATITVSGLPDATVLGTGPGRWSVRGPVTAAPGPVDVTITATRGACRGSTTFPLSVTPADLTIRWREPLIALTVGKPAIIAPVVSRPAGNQGDLNLAAVVVELRSLLGGETYERGPVVVGPDGLAEVVLAPGEIPLGLYLAQARLEPGAGYYRMVPPAATALVVNTDAASASVNGLGGL